jgi:hypothetical protein
MLTPAHLLSDLAADHTRTLLAEAAAHRLARTAATDHDQPATRRWPDRLLRRTRIEPTGEPA